MDSGRLLPVAKPITPFILRPWKWIFLLFWDMEIEVDKIMSPGNAGNEVGPIGAAVARGWELGVGWWWGCGGAHLF